MKRLRLEFLMLLAFLGRARGEAIETGVSDVVGVSRAC